MARQKPQISNLSVYCDRDLKATNQKARTNEKLTRVSKLGRDA